MRWLAIVSVPGYGRTDPRNRRGDRRCAQEYPRWRSAGPKWKGSRDFGDLLKKDRTILRSCRNADKCEGRPCCNDLSGIRFSCADSDTACANAWHLASMTRLSSRLCYSLLLTSQGAVTTGIRLSIRHGLGLGLAFDAADSVRWIRKYLVRRIGGNSGFRGVCEGETVEEGQGLGGSCKARRLGRPVDSGWRLTSGCTCQNGGHRDGRPVGRLAPFCR